MKASLIFGLNRNEKGNWVVMTLVIDNKAGLPFRYSGFYEYGEPFKKSAVPDKKVLKLAKEYNLETHYANDKLTQVCFCNERILQRDYVKILKEISMW